MNLNRVVATSFILFMLVRPAIAAPPEGKSSRDRDSAVAQQWIAAWNSHDSEKFLSAFTTDAFYEDTTSVGGVSHGSAELRKLAEAEFAAVPDLKVELTRASVSNGHGTIEWTFSGTDKDIYKTGRKFSVRGVSVIDVREGKISRCLDFYDAATIMKQVGVSPAVK